MSAKDYVNPSAPLDVELDRVYLTKGNTFHISLRFDDDAYVELDFAPGSGAQHRILDVLTRAATQVLSHLGASGVVIVGTTADDDEKEEHGARSRATSRSSLHPSTSISTTSRCWTTTTSSSRCA